MKGTARVLASFLAMFLAMLLVVPACLAQTFPSKPVRIVIPFPPGVPTVAEAANLPGFDSSVWLGLFAPAGTPPAVIQRLYQDFTQAILQPDIRQRLEALGLDPETKAPSEFTAFIRKETEIWSRIVRQAGIQGD